MAKKSPRCIACKYDLTGQSPGQLGEVLCPECGVKNLPPAQNNPNWPGGEIGAPQSWGRHLLWTLAWVILFPLLIIGIWLVIRMFP